MVTGTRVDAASSGFERAGVIPWLRGAGEGEGQGGCRARVEGCGDAHLGGGGLESLEEEAGGALHLPVVVGGNPGNGEF